MTKIDFTKCASMDLICISKDAPDMTVLVYGMDKTDLLTVPGGLEPGFKALERLKLNPRAYNSSKFTVKDIKIIKRSK